MGPNVIEVTDASFEQDVVQRSHQVPVVVDFWAAWCGPCRALGPVLERLAGAADGSWVLAKLDVDANPRISATAGIMGIPAVKAFKDGKIVDEFTGAIPEQQVKAWLSGFITDPAQELAQEGLAAEQRGDIEAARGLYEQALSINADEPTAKAGLERISLAEEASGIDEGQLQDRLSSSPNDVEAAAQLAKVKMVRGDGDFHETLIQQVRRFGPGGTDGPRQRLVDLINTMAPGDPRADQARRALSNALF